MPFRFIHKRRAGYMQQLRIVAIAGCLQVTAVSAFAISGSGTFTITSLNPANTATEAASGTYKTPSAIPATSR